MGLLLLMAVSCQNQVFDEPLPEEETVDIDNLSGIQRDIMVNVLSSKFGGYKEGQPTTRAAKSVSITPYIEDCDTLLYVVQYSDGWEVYSGSHATNMIILSSEKGQFDLSDTSFPPALKTILADNVQVIKTSINNQDSSVHPSWGAAAMNEKDFENGKTTLNTKGTSRAITYPEIPSGTWVLIESQLVSSEVEQSPKLIQTNWTQGYPWNTYSKLVETNNGMVRGYAGCIPIAVAQYLYYTHYLNDIPSTTITNAIDINNGNDYSFNGNSSSLWDKMAKTYSYPYSGLDETAMFIGYIGRELNAKYEEKGTSVYYSVMEKFLKEIYGVSFTLSPVNYSSIKFSILNKYPLLARADSNKKSSGEPKDEIGSHAFLIDCYKETVSTTKLTYGLIRDPWPSDQIDPYESNEIDEDGNIITWAYTNEIITTSTSNIAISMNWGYSSSYNNTFYSPSDSEWNAGGHNFNLNHYIYKRSDIK